MNTDTYADPGLDEPETSHEYRAPQPLAILTLLLGCLSFLALFRTTLWVFPVVALVLGVVSLRSLAANPERIGRKAAWLGMLLAAFFLTWAATYHYVREAWLVSHARQYADSWLDLLKQQELKEAHQLHVSRGKRAEAGSSLEDFYKKQRYAQSDFESFYDKEPLKEVVQFAPHAQFVFDSSRDRVSDVHTERIVLRYLARYEEQGKTKEMPLRLLMLRTIDLSTGDYYWEVEGIAGE